MSTGTKLYIDGPSEIYFGATQCDATAYASPDDADVDTYLLGETESGVTISYATNMHRISMDRYGGGEGVPAEMLIMSGQASVRGVIVGWGYKKGSATASVDTWQAFRAMAAGAYQDPTGQVTATVDKSRLGSSPLPGTPYFGDGYGFSLWVVGRNKSYLFPKCDCASQPREWNISSLEKKMSLNVTAYPIPVSGNYVVYFTGAGGGLLLPDCGITVR